MDPELFHALTRLVHDANYRMVIERDLAKEAYDRYQVLAKEAKASSQRAQYCEEALRLLCLNQPQGCEM